jgi:prepilin-type N-terminal cleavage/methylation domain-containing protein
MLRHFANEKGFTLMELLIAVAIVAVLAGVGIPAYLKLQSGAKATEANANLDGIRTCQESYKMVNNTYTACAVAPRAVGAVDENPAAWAGNADFNAIGFEPNADVRFAYAVGGASGTAYTAGALGDTDGDASYILYVASESSGAHVITAADDIAALQAADAFNDNATVTAAATSD